LRRDYFSDDKIEIPIGVSILYQKATVLKFKIYDKEKTTITKTFDVNKEGLYLEDNNSEIIINADKVHNLV